MSSEDIIAIFPLPNVVFFPKTNLPLHIFEPRYLQMVQDTRNNHQLIGMFLLGPGWQEDYHGNPSIHEIGCAGEISSIEELPDDKFNIVLRGLYRARVLETVQEYPYRKARVEIVPDVYSREEQEIDHLRLELLTDFKRMLRLMNQENVQTLLEGDIEEIVHSLATILQLDIDIKQRLLREDDLYIRGRLVHDFLRKQVSVLEWASKFSHLRPVDPSQN